MSERIRELEVALGAMHPDIPHPLLRQDLLQIKVPIELNNKIDSTSFSDASQTIEDIRRFDDNLQLQDASLPVLLNASGTLKMRPNGRSLFFGQCANAEASRIVKATVLRKLIFFSHPFVVLYEGMVSTLLIELLFM